MTGPRTPSPRQLDTGTARRDTRETQSWKGRETRKIAASATIGTFFLQVNSENEKGTGNVLCRPEEEGDEDREEASVVVFLLRRAPEEGGGKDPGDTRRGRQADAKVLLLLLLLQRRQQLHQHEQQRHL